MKKLSKDQMIGLRNKFNHDISDEYIESVVRKNSGKYKKYQREIAHLL